MSIEELKEEMKKRLDFLEQERVKAEVARDLYTFFIERLENIEGDKTNGD